ncbi:DUF4388 domain-containing protein [Spirilliplanes yamanashiensis]|uniref:PatA-like N-terminal domain-containing protein n=1 Tax=Spirilliplanes yamanashiensis TaxID=42233 RepID=A0A8J3YDI2_9ACTN|nr:DUF4388 domain-containing protein [Spirilliplanes yamanashiensis]MDP9816552.1 hypothetical protein [Spirilliplanes yamanashiensis]GIJ06079.1 hypothetical protein Sya03_54310 [Spirilliplanes yamanashiensis]
MKLGAPAKPRQVLEDLAGTEATGALHIGGASPGLLHLVGGRVEHASSVKVPGVGDLLTLSGRLPDSVWQAAVEEGGNDARVGELLVGQGHLTEGELQLCVLSVVHDAAYFVLGDEPVQVRFESDRRHWLGPVAAVDTGTVLTEVDRRARLLAEIADEPRLDTGPVTPTPRLRRDRIRLTALQWELIVHADGRATPTDLARRLGRAGYACLQAVRGLFADGLVRVPGTGAAIRTAPVPPPEPQVAVEALIAGGAVPKEVPRSVPIVAPRPPSDPPEKTVELPHAGEASASRGFRLPRRKPAKPRGDAEPAVPPDEALLHRLRTALRGMT